MSWQGFPSEYLPNDFYLHDAVAIDLKYNLLRFLWKQPQVFFTRHFLLKLVSTYLFYFIIFFSNVLSKKLSS